MSETNDIEREAAWALRLQEANRAAAEWQQRAITGENVAHNLEQRLAKQRGQIERLTRDTTGLTSQLTEALRLLLSAHKHIEPDLVAHGKIGAFLKGKTTRAVRGARQ